MDRRAFLINTAWSAASISSLTLAACNNAPKMEVPPKPEIKISLAQWSLHKGFQGGEINPVDFASITKNNFGIKAVEYVNQFYVDHGTDEKFWNDMKMRADDVGVKKPFNYGRCRRRPWRCR